MFKIKNKFVNELSKSPQHKVIYAFLLVILTVVINLMVAVSLDVLASKEGIHLIFIVLTLSIVLGLNGIRFLLWGIVHALLPLNKSYPLSAIFFPLIVVVSYLRGEETTILEFFGSLLIALGVSIISLASSKDVL